MRIEYIKDSEPHFKGSVVEVDSTVGAVLIENGTGKKVDAETELKNVAADESQNGVSILDQRKKKAKPAKDSKEDEADEADEDEGDAYDDMNGEALKAELKKRELPVSGSVDELRARLRENDAK